MIPIKKILTAKIKVAVVDTLKELGRVLLFSAVSFGISKLSSLPESEGTLVGLIILRVLDKAVHEYGKSSGNETLVTGLSRF